MWRGHSYPRTIANSLKQFAGGSAHSAVRYILYMPKSSRSTAKARVLSSREVYRGPVFWVTSDEVIEPAGVRVRRAIVRHSCRAVILALAESGAQPKTLLARQYRHAAEQFSSELPAGRTGPGRTDRTAAIPGPL